MQHMMFPTRELIAAALLLLCDCGTDGFFEVISPVAPGGGGTTCRESTRRPVSSLEVGEVLEPEMVGPPQFALLEEGAPVTIVRGVQGADMLVLALRVSGAGDQTCIAQRTDIYDDAGKRLSFNALPKRFVPQPDGTSISDRIFFPGLYVLGPATIEVSLGGQHLSRIVEVMP